MSEIFYNKDAEIVGYGKKNASIQFMLPTPPEHLNAGESINDIVTSNGNHWRKIFVIIAKLCCGKTSWQHYRTHDLLNEVYLNFSMHPTFDKQLNIVCGKTHSQSINIYEQSLSWQVVDELARVRINKENSANRIIITPYLDYRQFPNALIEEVIKVYSSN